MCACLCGCMRVHTWTCAYVYAHVCSPYVHVHACVCVDVHVCAHMYKVLVTGRAPGVRPGRAGPEPCAGERGPGRWRMHGSALGPSLPQGPADLECSVPAPRWRALAGPEGSRGGPERPCPWPPGVWGEWQVDTQLDQAEIRADDPASPWPGCVTMAAMDTCLWVSRAQAMSWWLVALPVVYRLSPQLWQLFWDPRMHRHSPWEAWSGSRRTPEETGRRAAGGWGPQASCGRVSSRRGGGCCGSFAYRGPGCCCFSIKPDLTELGSCASLRAPLTLHQEGPLFWRCRTPPRGLGQVLGDLGGRGCWPCAAALARAPLQARASACLHGTSKE